MPPKDRKVEVTAENGTTVKPMVFSEFLGGLEGGSVDRRASRELERLVEGVRVHRKAGKMVVELKIEPATPKNARQVFVTALKVEAKPPKASPDPSIYFTNHNNGLQRDNPDQMRMKGEGFDTED